MNVDFILYQLSESQIRQTCSYSFGRGLYNPGPFVIFVAVLDIKQLMIASGRGSLGNAPRFSHIREKAIFVRFKTLSAKNGITYQSRRKSVLNRRNAKNNLFWPETAK